MTIFFLPMKLFELFKNKYFKRWFWQALLGLILLQSGLCMVVEAGFWKHNGAETWQWVVAGTISLGVFYSGANLMVDSLRFRIKWLEEKEKNKPE